MLSLSLSLCASRVPRSRAILRKESWRVLDRTGGRFLSAVVPAWKTLWRHPQLGLPPPLPHRHLSTSPDGGGNDPEPPVENPPALLSALTPEFRESLSGRGTLRRLRLRAIEEELLELQSDGFPLPEALDAQQWSELMDLPEKDLRVRYLDGAAQGPERGREALEEMGDELRAAREGITFTEKMFAGLRSEDEEAATPLSELVFRVQKEYDALRQEGELLPHTFKEIHLKELAEAESPRKIRGILEYLGEKRRRVLRSLIEKRAATVESRRNWDILLRERAEEKHLIYGLGNNCIMLRRYPQDMVLQESWKEVREFHSWGQPIVIDLAFMDLMRFKQAKSFIMRELTWAINENRNSFAPFAMYLCNFNPDSEKCRLIEEVHPRIRDPASPVYVTEKSYLELFPQKSLVYLTPNSPEEMEEFSHDQVYIVGGLVDKGLGLTNTTLAQAKRENIRHAKLPLRRYLG